MHLLLDMIFQKDNPSAISQAERFRSIFRQLPMLCGERLMLRMPVMHDAGDFYSFARDEENCRYVLWDAHQSVSDSRDVLRGIIRRNRRGDPATFAIALKNDNRLIGTIGFQWIDIENRSCEVGYSIARRLWNRGLGTEALGILLPFAFEKLGLNRVEAKHDVLNPASGKVLLHLGFRQEGIARSSLSLKGRMADMVHYALLKEDWIKSGEALKEKA